MKKKNKKRKLRLFHLIIGFLFIYVSLIFMNQRKLMKELETKKLQNLSVVKELEKDIKRLTNEIKNSDSLDFVEKIARDELGMVKPREIIYVDKNKSKNPFMIFRKK